jgi:hypothetical protein
MWLCSGHRDVMNVILDPAHRDESAMREVATKKLMLRGGVPSGRGQHAISLRLACRGVLDCHRSGPRISVTDLCKQARLRPLRRHDHTHAQRLSALAGQLVGAIPAVRASFLRNSRTNE